LRAPLRAVRNLAEWIDEDFKAGEMEEVASHVTMMREKVNKLDDMVDGMLRYSRSIREEPELASESIDLNELVKDIVDYVVPPPDFNIDVPVPLPLVDSPRPPLQQILTNLIANAIKHHDRPDGTITITAKPADKPDYLAVTVRDDGPGIDPVYHERIFVIFHTIPGQDKPDSTGIGLAVVRKLVEHHGGTIKLESEPGKGAAFHFTWPTKPDAQ
jgi:signal transduction histidine kinase